ncbi:cytochrome P450 6k1-like [Homalodisca vitripennis]|uniref:cytochrome P450 6k1-like n=1 Tax=Homalodisca vitripennis TaxID=197043 RepID=UPI001EEC4AE5|nr:cytochrome P450 6k1-like [Homalodisca vitripennis]
MLTMVDWLLLAVGLLAACYWYLSWNMGYWRARGVYTLPGALPGVGHMLDALLLRRGVQTICIQAYHNIETKGQPAVGLYLFRQPVLMLKDPDLIQTVLIKEFSSFHDNAVQVDDEVDPYVSRNPFITRGQRWKTLRQKLSPAFSPVRIKVMFPLIQAVGQEFNKYMKKHLNENVNVNHVTGLFTSEVVAKCAFGLDGNAFNDPDALFYQHGRKLWDGTLNSPIESFIIFLIPSINKILKRSFFPKETAEFFENVIKQAIEYRQKAPDKVADNDYLQFLINLHNKNEFGLIDVVAQCLTFFTDGFETSSLTASFALYELTMNPDIQESLRQEVLAADSLNYDSISSLPLLDRVLQETLRKYSVFAMTKECSKDFTLQADGRSFPIKKGQHVVVPVYAIHNDPNIYPNPDIFDPDRFLPENIKTRHPISFMGFSAGPRTCIGNKFATCQVKVLLANILANFKLVKCNKTAEKMKLNPLLLMPVPEGGIWLQFQEL